MNPINITELHQHLQSFIDRVQAGEEFVITRRGKPVARMVRAYSAMSADVAMKQLDALHGSVIVGDVMSPFN